MNVREVRGIYCCMADSVRSLVLDGVDQGYAAMGGWVARGDPVIAERGELIATVDYIGNGGVADIWRGEQLIARIGFGLPYNRDHIDFVRTDDGEILWSHG